MVMRARVILRIKQVEHCNEDEDDDEADDDKDGDDDEDDDDDEGDDVKDDDDDDDDNIVGAGQAVVNWCGDCGQVIKPNISKLNIYITFK